MKTNQDYVNLISQLEEESRNFPLMYYLKVAAIIALGYAYIAFFVALALSIIGATGLLMYWIATDTSMHIVLIKLVKFIWVPLVLLWFILKSLFHRIPEPYGLHVTARDCPILFKKIEEMSKKLQVGKIDRVLITQEFNAAITRIPLLGFLGFNRTYLLLGYPMLDNLTSKEMDAVLAHELGHISKNHSRIRGWVYNQRLTWLKLEATLMENPGFGEGWFLSFFYWYIPFFDAYTFVVARKQEYEADQEAVKLYGQEPMGQALVKTVVIGKFVDLFYLDVQKSAITNPHPPEKVFMQLSKAVKDINPDSALQTFENALKFKTSVDDTHPCLRDRLHAIGFEPKLHPFDFQYPAAAWLGYNVAKAIEDQLNIDYIAEIDELWSYHHEINKTLIEEKNELKSRLNTINTEDKIRLGRIYMELFEEQQAIELFNTMLPEHHNNPILHFNLGMITIKENSEAGKEHLLKALELDETLGVDCIGIIMENMSPEIPQDEQNKLFEQFEDLQEKSVLAQNEREYLLDTDIFKSHGLSVFYIDQIKVRLQSQSKVKKFWLVQKRLEYYPQFPAYYLVCPWPYWSVFTDDGNYKEKILDSIQDLLTEEDLGTNATFYVYLEKDLPSKLLDNLKAASKKVIVR